MSDWDSMFGEAAMGLDLAKADPARDGSGHAPTDPVRRPAGPARPARSSLKLARPTAPTTNHEAIFRREALEFRVRGRHAPAGVVRLGARWIHWFYRMLCVLVLAAVAAVCVIHTDESASGPAVIDGRAGTVAFLLPAAVGPELANSQKFTVALPGAAPVGISGLHAQLADDAAIRKAGLVPLTQPAILVTGKLDPGAGAASVVRDTRLQAQASVVLRSESLADLLGRQFQAMLSNASAP
jgi:hypothetical protein